ncbi:SCO6745 family protein [Streptomyces sp. BR1]|uniref:SCO6745 family protein n=1 Tax=Streptomyces sp. BR1 TaxID=1592323 RepID=UPI00402B4D11
MAVDSPEILARRLWAAVEPLHGIVYFAEESVESMRRLGLKGYYMGYFAGRLCPVGPLDAPAGHALSFAFAPGRVARALPDAWTYASPEEVLAARLDVVSAVLGRALPPAADVVRLTQVLESAAEGCTYEGRVLAAAWSGVARPSDPLARLWLAATVLREHRGDGHVMALAQHGLGGLDAGITHVAAGGATREQIQVTRGWSEEEWEAGVWRLRVRGLVDSAGLLTAEGERVRESVESATDRLAAGPVARLGAEGVAEAVSLAAPLSRHLMDTGVLPVPNPIGVPRP